MKVRLYVGKRAKDIDLGERDGFSIGSRYNDDLRLPGNMAKGVSVDLTLEPEGWKAVCRGNVTCRGRLVQEIPFTVGCVLVMDAAYGVVIEGIESDGEGVVVPLEGHDVVTIGRSPQNIIKLPSKLVTAVHATLSRTEGGWYVTDASLNGTFINGRRIKRELLRVGDTIMIGEYTIRFLGRELRIFGGSSPNHTRTSAYAKRRTKQRAYPFFESAPRIMPVKKSEEIEVQGAPGIGGAPNVNWFFVLLPTLMMVLFYTLYAVLQRSLSFMIMMPMMMMGAVMSFFNLRSQKKRYKTLTRLRKEKYTGYIEQTCKTIEDKNRRQLKRLREDNPSPGECLTLVRRLKGRLWNRKPTDPDFMCVRLGTGSVPSELTIKIPAQRLELEEDEYSGIPEGVRDKYIKIADAPVVCDLKRFAAFGAAGPRDMVCRLAREMTVEIASAYRYDEVRIAAFFPEREEKEWDWLRWLPHCFDETRSRRHLACTEYDAKEVCRELSEIFKERIAAKKAAQREKEPVIPHYVIVVADPSLVGDPNLFALLQSGDPELGFSAIFLNEKREKLPRGTQAIAECDAEGRARLITPESADEPIEFVVDDVEVSYCDAFARQCAPVRLPEKADEYLLPSCVTFLEGLNAADASELRIAENWQKRPEDGSLAVPIGIKSDGEMFYFDIHEKRHGPHGLVAGMTGSGKSEMVQSWILAMALRYSPQDVSFVIIDFKGTGLILPFADLPHLAGAVSNLDVNISRNLIALESELKRRQALFDAAGVNNIEKYLRLLRDGQVKEPLSYMFVVIDEYAEFKVKFPDFTNEINSLFRTGRSLGISIILLTQNPSGIVSAQSEDNVKFRWCLKVANSAASKEMLGRPDAAKLLVPGRAYVKVGEDEVYELVQSFWSGAPFRAKSEERVVAAPRVSVVDLRGKRTALAAQTPGPADRRSAQTEIDVIMREIIRSARENGGLEARKIWQQRLKSTIFLDEIEDGGEDAGGLRPVVGMLDNPYEQKQTAFRLPLDEGHAAVFGSPGSGKTTLMQTLVTSLCLNNPPDEVNIYIMDFGGWNFKVFEGFPQVVAAASGSEEERISAVVRRILDELETRKELFAKGGVGNIDAYRRLTGEACPRVVIIVDNFAPVLQTYPEYEGFFRDVSLSGGSYGISFVFTSNSTVSLGFKIKQNIKTSVALNMPERSDYVDIVGRTEGLEPDNVRGRGLCRHNGVVLEFQTALPAHDSIDERRVRLLEKLGAELSERWRDKHIRSLRVMPQTVSVDDVSGVGFGIGIGYETLEPVSAGLCGASNTLAVSAPESERAGLLRLLVKYASGLGETALFGCGEGLDGCRCFSDAPEFDGYVEKTVRLLNDRKEGKQEQPFSPIYIFIDNWRESHKAISDGSAKRLHRIARMAKKLGVFLTVLGESGDFVQLSELGEPLTRELMSGSVVAMGGSLSETPVESTLPFDKRAERLSENDGWFIQNKTATKFKAVYTED